MIATLAVSIFMLAFSTEETQAAAEGLRLTVEEKTATAEELRSAYVDLERLNQSLDDVVETRTQELQHALSHNKFLLSEINHRVKNNLQLISGLVSLHGRQVEAPDIRNKLAAIKTQIISIATIYDILHQMESAEIVDFCKVVPVLCRNIEAAGGGEASIRGDAQGEAQISADTAVSLALAVNELVTNSIKHGGQKSPPTIIVTCEAWDRTLTLVVRDDGPGFPAGYDIMQGKGFGMRMVQDVITRTGGSADLGEPPVGAEVRITVPIETMPKRESD
jgi:two-component sensor histidine kinase